MDIATAATLPPAERPRRLPAWRLDFILGTLVLGLTAWTVARQFAVEWEVNPQYAYGWTVPFLTGLLLWRRWRERPAPEPSVRPVARAAAWTLAGLLALFWVPARVVQEANPDWRPWGWGMATVTVGLALTGAFLLGGGRWARWFAFPLLFALVAAPWPERMENMLIQGLMRAVSAAAVEFLDLLGVPAVRRGNLIAVGGSGLIGVEEACSGIRSLQATLMAGLFLGEYYRLRGAVRRGGLLLAGVALALTTNLLRTFFLVWLSVREGSEAFARWHDRAGLAVLVSCLLCLWLLALWWSPAPDGGDDTAAPDGANRPPRPPTATGSPPPAPGLSLPALAALATVLLGAEGVTHLWYRWREANSTGHPVVTWTAQPPTDAPGLRIIPVPDAARALLRYTEGGATAWSDRDGAERWTLFFARWAPGRGAAASAGMHTPGVCLTAAGKTLLADLGTVPVRCVGREGFGGGENHPGDGLHLPLHGYRFDTGVPALGRDLWVFHCVWEDRPEATSGGSNNGGTADTEAAAPPERALSARGRLRAAWAGRRNLGQRVLEVTLLGPTDADEALARVYTELPAMVTRTTSAVAAGDSARRF